MLRRSPSPVCAGGCLATPAFPPIATHGADIAACTFGPRNRHGGHRRIEEKATRMRLLNPNRVIVGQATRIAGCDFRRYATDAGMLFSRFEPFSHNLGWSRDRRRNFSVTHSSRFLRSRMFTSVIPFNGETNCETFSAFSLGYRLRKRQSSNHRRDPFVTSARC